MAKGLPVPAIVWREDDLFVAKTVGIELASQGKTKKEALKNLQEALDLLLEDNSEKITPKDVPSGVDVKVVYA